MEDDSKKKLFEDSSFNSQELLGEAIERVNALHGSLGKGGTKSKLGKALATLNGDKVEMGTPDVFPITDNSFYKKKFEIPVDLSQVFANNRFFYVEFPIGLKTKSNWSFNKYRLFLEFENKDAKVIDMLPSDKLKEVFKVQGEFNIGIDTTLTFRATSPEINLQKAGAKLTGQAGAGVDSSAQLNFIKPPFEYSLKKWEIKTEGKDLYYIDWEFFSIDENMKNESRNLRAILRVPKSVNELKMNGALVAYRNPDSFKTALTGLFSSFGETLKSWFMKGVPIPFPVKNYDLLAHIQHEI